MYIIISPSKQMKMSDDFFGKETKPLFLKEAKQLVKHIQELDLNTLKKYMKCSEKIAKEAYQNYQSFHFENNPTPALFAYSGIQFQYMAPGILQDSELEYLQNHLYILSGLYGLLKPFDDIVSYRLEMQTKIPFSLYDFWSDQLAKQIDEPILNLASEEYAKCIRKYKKVVDVRFCQIENGKLKEKGVYAKMARGAMVRFLAENKIENIEQIKVFNDQNYVYTDEYSNESLYVFIQKNSV